MSLSDEQRMLFAQSLLTVAAIFGVWNFVVRPAGVGLTEARADIEIASAEREARESRATERPADGSELLSRLEAQALEFETRVGVGRDPSKQFAVYRTLATDAGLSLRRIEPLSSARRTERNDTGATLYTAGHRMTVNGKYERVARFLDSIQDSDGLNKVTSLRLAPAPGPGMVDASIEVKLFWFDGPIAEAAEGSVGGAGK